MIEASLVREEGDGSILGVMLAGHHDDDTAVAVAWHELAEEDALAPIKHPWRCWVRKVPRSDGWFEYVYASKPGPGASPVTVVDLAPAWQARCDWRHCPWDSVLSVDARQVPGAPDDRPFARVCRGHAVEVLGGLLGDPRELVDA